jgi:hypothetical protein
MVIHTDELILRDHDFKLRDPLDRNVKWLFTSVKWLFIPLSFDE